MAFRAISRHFVISPLKNGCGMVAPHRSFASSATADATHYHHHGRTNRMKGEKKADLVPIYMLAGFIVVVLSIGTHTAKQQLMHNPNVLVKKKRREGFPEVRDPQSLIDQSDKFLGKSFLRKVGHIQADHNMNHVDPAIRPNPYTK